MRSFLLKAATIAAASLFYSTASAATVTIDPGATWNGFMNWFATPADGGGYVGGGGWAPADLRATFSGPVLTLAPNTNLDRDVPTDPYWWKPDTTANKYLEANMYIQDDTGTLSGTSLSFSGTVVSNTLAAQYSVVAFIKDFASDYSSNVTTTIPVSSGDFSVTANTVAGAGRHVQYGLWLFGPPQRLTDNFGNMQLTALVPEPASLGFVAVAGLLAVRRRRVG